MNRAMFLKYLNLFHFTSHKMSIEQADDSLLIARMQILSLRHSFCSLSNAFTNANTMMYIQYICSSRKVLYWPKLRKQSLVKCLDYRQLWEVVSANFQRK